MKIIVLRTYPLNESDLIAQVYSESMGKISLVAKHARNSKKRFAGSLELFDSGIVIISTKSKDKELKLIDSFANDLKYRKLRDKLETLCLASLLCESYNILTRELQNNANENYLLYENLDTALNNLLKSENLKESFKVVFIGLSKLLTLEGFKPEGYFNAPSLKNFIRLVSHIEDIGEKELYSKEQVLQLASGL